MITTTTTTTTHHNHPPTNTTEQRTKHNPKPKTTVGTFERSKDFVRETGFPAERLLADPDGDAYAALGLVKGVAQTFFSVETPLALLRRMQRPGGLDDLRDRVLPRWQPWQPPRGFNQALQQGGVFVFDGDELAYSHFDQATGAHADLDGVVALARDLVVKAEAGAAACAADGGSSTAGGGAAAAGRGAP